MNIWLFFFATIVAIYILCGLIIPFGQVIVQTAKFNNWVNLAKKNQNNDTKGKVYSDNAETTKKQ